MRWPRTSVQPEDLDDLAALAGRLLDAPYAVVRFVDRRQVRRAPGGGAGTLAPVVSAADLAVDADPGLVDVPLDGDASPLSEPELVRHHPPLRRVAAACLVSPEGRRIGAIEVGWSAERPALDDRERTLLEQAAAHASRMLELRAEADAYRRCLQLNPDAVTVLDLEGAIELVNPAMAALLGVPHAAGLVGRPFLDLVRGSDRERVATGLARVLLSRHTTFEADLHLERADGTSVPCALHAGGLSDRRRSVQLVLRDLTARIRAEQERTSLSEQLGQAQRLDLAGRLASGLAHDLNNLLTVMSVTLEMLEEDTRELAETGRIPATIREDVGRLTSSVSDASQLTGKLLEFAGQEPGAPTQVDVAAAMRSVERLLRPTLPAGVRFEVEIEPDLPTVSADRVQLEQAMVNLVVNASDAIADHGTITLRARRAGGASPSPPRAPLEAAGSARTSVCLEVVDDGSGMDDETAARAFEPLFSTRKSQGGTGLGLPTVQTFVDQAGGRVELRSWPQEGTSIRLLLPAGSAAVPSSVVRRRETGTRILLVDPAGGTRRVIASMLRSGGHRVQEAASAEEALRLAERGAYDLVATDLSLPGRSGWRLIEQLRTAVRELPAVVFTSSGASPRLAGVRTLVKPFSNERLLRAVEELVAPAR